jgi:hypothetical protein
MTLRALAGVLVIALLAGWEMAGFGPAGPRMVGEGVISTPDDESGFALSDNVAVFGKVTPTTAGTPLQVVCVSRMAGGRWGTPEVAPFSGMYRDFGPAMIPGGTRLFFISDRPTGDTKRKDLNIWYVDRRTDGWGEPQLLGEPVNSISQEYGVSVTKDGTLYFSSNRAGGKGSFDLYRAVLTGGEYRTAENLGAAINTEGLEVQPAISPDERTLVFTALGRDDEITGVHKQYNKGDLYISFRRNGEWTPARNCGPRVNSGGEESWPQFSSDGQRLFFSSERGFATYRISRRLTRGEFERGLNSVLNGMGNIYEVDTSALGSVIQ